MTALTAAPAASLRPVPWPRLAWVVWRRYRTTLGATLGVLALLAIYMVINGNRMRSAYAAMTACRPVDAAHCQFQYDNFRNSYPDTGLIGVMLLFLPGIIGAFAGAPVLARELETGTFRYAWTQGVGRMRWGFAVIIPGAIGVAMIMGAFGALVSWYNQPMVQAGIKPRLQPAFFPATGIAAAGWALAGFALGVTAGLLWRRVLPALATGFAVWFGLAYLTSRIRPYYLTPLTTSRMQTPNGALVLTTWFTKGGVRVSDAQLNTVLQSIGFQMHSGGGGKVTVGPGGTGVDPFQYLQQHGFRQVTSYQPASRYWTFQWIEFGWLVALAVLLLGASLWLLRRRSG